MAKNNSPVAVSPRADAVGEITIDEIIESTGGLVTDLQPEDRLYMETVVNGKYEARATTVGSIAEFGGGGELPDLTEYAKLEDLDTATNFTAINPTLDTPAPEVLDKVVTDIENEVKTNTTAITHLTGRVTNLENSGGGGDVFVEPIYIPIVSADINTADHSIIVDLSAYPDNTSFCIDVDILDTEAIFIINIIGTDVLNGFLEELYLRGNIGFTDTESTKATDLFIEGVRIVGILARVLRHRIKCRYTINNIDNIFYYAKYDENGGYIDAIYCDRNEIDENFFSITDTTTFFFPLEPLKKKGGVTGYIPYTGLAYVPITFLGVFEYYLDCSMLIINSVVEQSSVGNYKYAQDNVQDYLLFYGRRTYLPNIYFPRVHSDDIKVTKELIQTELLYASFEAVSGNNEFSFTPYMVTAIGRFGKVMDVGKMTEQA
ncbi:hypothetical protein [Romboutsia sp.]|uniref:hypothetical protein n=1 Tax=Romboutsia sp. TaxID=1965302 RepID=UPI003F336145